MGNPHEKIGTTTTVPIERLLAAGYQPVDRDDEFHPSRKGEK